MDKKLSLSNLSNIHVESINRDERTLAFEITNGRGRFLFLMFFDSNDKSTQDMLFIFMRNTQRLLSLKMYGNHNNGQFDVYVKPFMERWFKEELQLNPNDTGSPFVFDRFFESLNGSMPQTLPLSKKIEILRDTWSEVGHNLPNEVIQEADKIYLIGPKRLPKNKTPRERTLRKLYLFTEAKPSDIQSLIENLKKLNMTLAWTADETKKKESVLSILNSLK